ncbi:hypothetical protein KHA80_16410 [Anaerobacillus sp. HL2]|nr:hypothetical protein KHA80_16410 [Anaerobacillus sp. HL2]
MNPKDRKNSILSTHVIQPRTKKRPICKKVVCVVHCNCIKSVIKENYCLDDIELEPEREEDYVQKRKCNCKKHVHCKSIIMNVSGYAGM